MLCLRHRYISLSRCFSSCLPAALDASRSAALSEAEVECSAAETVSSEETNEQSELYRRYLGKQHLILYGYQGARYYGNTLQEGQACLPTVERELLHALARTGALTGLDLREGPRRFSRMSRTDRGVSAIGQCCCMQMHVFPGLIDAVNAELPSDVRVFALQRVVPSTEIRRRCRSRHYSYTMPTFALSNAETPVDYHFRIDADQLAYATAQFQQYVGTNNYHNFSPGGSSEDLRMVRIVVSVSLDPPVVVNGVEFVTVHFHGFSFVLSQIRRMVGMVIAVCRGGVAADTIQRALTHHSVRTTTAPGLGLMLEYGEFDSSAYYWQVHGSPQFDHVRQQMEDFRQNVILEYIYRTELATNSMFDYVRNLLLRQIGGDRNGRRFTNLGAVDYWLTVSSKSENT